MIIRPATVQDASAIRDIHNPIIRDTLITFTTTLRSESEIAADITSPIKTYLVATGTDKLLGFASFGPFRSGPGYDGTCEHTIILAPTARGKGVGRALMLRLEQAALTAQKRVMVAGISGANRAGIAFHQKIGFTIVGRMPGVGQKQSQQLDLVLMQKRLRPENAPDTTGLSR